MAFCSLSYSGYSIIFHSFLTFSPSWVVDINGIRWGTDYYTYKPKMEVKDPIIAKCKPVITSCR